MIRKITIATISVLLSASLLFTLMTPLIPDALEVYFKDRYEMTCKLMIIGLVVSFILGTILTLVCVFWKDKTKEELL
jgi:hypothetical protein